MPNSYKLADSIDPHRRFQETFELAAIGMAHVSLDGRFEMVNQKLCDLFGYTQDELRNIKYQDITFKGDQSINRNYAELLINGPEESFAFEKRYVRKNGDVIWIDLFISLVRDGAGRPKYFVAMINEKTREKLRELQLQEQVRLQTVELEQSKRELDRFFHTSVDYFAIANLDGYFKVVNDSFVNALGYSREELTSQPYENFVVEEDRKATDVTAGELRNGIPTMQFENRFRAKDGSIRWFSWRAFPHQEEGLIYASARDVTDLKQKEQLIVSQRAMVVEAARLNSLGQMAAGIAHEINNPLSVFYLNTLHLRELADEAKLHSPEFLETVDKLEEMTWRMTSIIKGLKTFARDGAEDPFEAFSIKDLIQSTLSLVEVFCRRGGIELEVDEVSENLFLSGRSVQLSQVLVNLVSNAVDAVKNLEKKWIKIRVDVVEKFVQIKVIDSGKGVDEKIQKKIFDPFFTTKPVGKGTGLGLSISLGIAQAHEGQLYYDSTSPNTCFVLSLPFLNEGA